MTINEYQKKFTDLFLEMEKEHGPCIAVEIVNWLNAHHFDYHNLIEHGLAIEVTEENNPYKK